MANTPNHAPTALRALVFIVGVALFVGAIYMGMYHDPGPGKRILLVVAGVLGVLFSVAAMDGRETHDE